MNLFALESRFRLSQSERFAPPPPSPPPPPDAGDPKGEMTWRTHRDCSQNLIDFQHAAVMRRPRAIVSSSTATPCAVMDHEVAC